MFTSDISISEFNRHDLLDHVLLKLAKEATPRLWYGEQQTLNSHKSKAQFVLVHKIEHNLNFYVKRLGFICEHWLDLVVQVTQDNRPTITYIEIMPMGEPAKKRKVDIGRGLKSYILGVERDKPHANKDEVLTYLMFVDPRDIIYAYHSDHKTIGQLLDMPFFVEKKVQKDIDLNELGKQLTLEKKIIKLYDRLKGLENLVLKMNRSPK